MADSDEYFAQLALASRGPVSLSIHKGQRRNNGENANEDDHEDAIQGKVPTWYFPKTLRQAESHYRTLTPPKVINDQLVVERKISHQATPRRNLSKPNSVDVQRHLGISDESFHNLISSELNTDDLFDQTGTHLVALHLNWKSKANKARGSIHSIILLRAGGEHGNSLFVGYMQTHKDRKKKEKHSSLPTLRESVLHTFPTRICSIYSAKKRRTSTLDEKAGRICIRTISSTLFADIKINENSNDSRLHFDFVGLLEIMHGRSTIPSGVHGGKSKSGLDKMRMERSPSSINDVVFRSGQSHEALAIDAQGTLSQFQAENKLNNSEVLTNGTRWNKVFKANSMEVLPETKQYFPQWSLNWLSDANIALSACPKGLFAVDVQAKERVCIFIAPLGDRIWSCRLVEEPRPLIWIVTTTDICILEADPALEYRQLLSFAHERSTEGGLYLTLVDFQLTSQTIALWDRSSQLLFLQTVSFEGINGSVHVQSKQDHIRAMDLCENHGRVCQTLILDTREYEGLLQFQSQEEISFARDAYSSRIVLELSTCGRIFMSTIIRDEGDLNHERPSSDRLPIVSHPRTDDEGHSAAYFLLSFGEMYKSLMESFDRAGTQQATESLHEEIEEAFLGSLSLLEKGTVTQSNSVLPIDLLSMALQGTKLFKAGRPQSQSFTLQTGIVAQNLLSSQFNSFLDKYVDTLRSARVGKYSGQLVDKDFEFGNVLGVEQIAEKIAAPFHDQYVQNSRSRKIFSANALRLKICRASEEVAADMALTTISMIRKDSVSDAATEGEKENVNYKGRKSESIPVDVPNFTRSFFKSDASSSSQKASKSVEVSTAAHLLLDEWTLGADPSGYQFSHPYDDGEEEDFSSYQNDSSGRQTPDSNRSSSLRPSQSQSRTLVQTAAEPFYPRFGPGKPPYFSQSIESAAAQMPSWVSHSQSNSNLSPIHFPTTSSDVPVAPESAPQLDTTSSQKQSQKVRKKRRVGGF